MPGTRDNPVQLDPFQNIVNVGWSTVKGMLAFQFEITNSLAQPTVPPLILTGLPWNTGAQYQLNSSGAVTFTNQQGQVVFRKPDPYFRPASTEQGPLWRGWFFIDLKLARAYLPENSKTLLPFRVNTPACGEAGESTTTIIYWMWTADYGASSFEQNLANPVLVGDFANPPFGVMVVPRAFPDPGSRQVYIDNYISPEMQAFDETVTEPSSISRQWRLDAESYATRTSFPIDSQGNALWNRDTATSNTTDDVSGTISNPKPAKVVSYTVKLTDPNKLRVTSAQVPPE